MNTKEALEIIEKMTPKTMKEIKLGQLIPANEEPPRDAIHVAIAPIIAAELLHPGDHVGLDADGKACEDEPHIGIVDPFLTRRVLPGESFWLLMLPGTTTKPTHHWTHPALDDEKPARGSLEEYERDDDGCRGCES